MTILVGITGTENVDKIQTNMDDNYYGSTVRQGIELGRVFR